jgi:CotS family spore coat protein
MNFEIFTEDDRQKERELLATYDLDIDFFERLGVRIKQIVPERGCYRIETDKGFFCLKKMSFPFQDIFLMQQMAVHLVDRGFENVSKIVRQADGGILVPYNGSEYYLTQWMDGRESDYLNLSDIKAATETLAKLHAAAEGFGTKFHISSRRLYGKWKEGFLKKLWGIEEARRLVDAGGGNKDNTQIIAEYLKSCEKEAEHAIDLLEESSYDRINARDEGKHGFIHHDYGLYNITHTFTGETFVGGLEGAAFDIRMHDLGYLIFKLMRRRSWDMDIAMAIISYYDEIFKLEKEDYQALTVYLAMPHDFNQFQRVYYSEDIDMEDLEELERINIGSEYSASRRSLLREMKKISGLA